MRSRISGRTLLPAVLAAAAVTAVGAPALARHAPPPAPDAQSEPAAETYTEDDCAQALKILAHYKLLPNQPDVGRTLCSLNQEKKQEQEQAAQDQPAQDQAAQGRPTEGRPTEGRPAGGRPAQSEKTNQISSKHTTESGKVVEENKILGVPVEWPKSLTVHVPTVNDHWYTYTSKEPGTSKKPS
ncbi:hypothetical protein [Actinomadura sp. 9N215]|uniref:hypothetical protein n=1 Tax=Actinomadura sp. 9N215 TaxID=3375150 RepID=UPI0037AB2531